MKKLETAKSAKAKKPQWWQLYLMLPLLAGLYLPEMRLRITSTEHIIAQLGILGLIYAFLRIWMQANRRALMGIDEDQGEWRFRVYEFPATESSAGRNGTRATGPLLHLPEAGVKGMLSTTFELDEHEPGSGLPAGSEVLYSERIFSPRNSSPVQEEADAKV
jgi:hypothetical protein